MPHVNPQSFRKNFPILKDTVYLSSCSLGARSSQLDQSIADMLDAMSDGAGAWRLFEEQLAASREKFARLIGARPEQIAVMPNASVGAYQIASCMDWSDRPEILTSVAEFPSIAHVWLAQKERGAKVVFTPAVEETAFAQSINAQTGLVSVPVIAYSDGQRLDVKSITDAAHAKGARVFVDAYQALGVEPLDVNAMGCDYLVAGASKYLLGLPGVAFVYERTRSQDDCEPQLTGWFGRKNPFAFDPQKLDFATDARRYETGTPSVPALYAANAGLDLLLDLDMEQVRNHISGLVDHVQDQLGAAGIQCLGPTDSAQRGAHVAIYDKQSASLETHLSDQGIRISPRGDLARLAFHYYNTIEDADVVCKRIKQYHTIKSCNQRCGLRETNGDAAACRVSPGFMAQALLSKWRNAPNSTAFPYPTIIAAFHEKGKEFVSKPLLSQLDAIRSAARDLVPDITKRRKLVQFLDVALDKFDDTYEYSSYCALPLWPLPTHPGASPDLDKIDVLRDRQLLALTVDFLQFELNTRQGRVNIMPELRPDPFVYEKRVRMGLHSARYAVERLNLPIDCTAKDFEAEAEKLCDLVQSMLSVEEKKALKLTMQPVYVVHDEYMFLRVLQLFETNFAWMAIRLQSAIAAFQSDRSQVAPLIADANRMYREASKFFPVLATLQRDAFQGFRIYTDGASAIQSRNYKLVESLCRTPDETRRDGPAYRSVPEIRDLVKRGQPNLDDALAAARAEKHLTPEIDADICKAMEAFSNTLQQWRQIHFRLAVKMLGEATPGTGATEGTPYLNAVRSIPVFKTIPSGDLRC
ncbi:MAG: aminotransferase class V-fold PLP-dependent enzyme [Paracoccaceae bacterium]